MGSIPAGLLKDGHSGVDGGAVLLGLLNSANGTTDLIP